MTDFSSIVTVTTLSFRQRTALRLPKEQRFSCLHSFQPDRGDLAPSNTDVVSVKRLGPKTDHSLLPNTEVKNVWIHPSAPPYALGNI